MNEEIKNQLLEAYSENKINWKGDNRETIEMFCQLRKYGAYDWLIAQSEAKQITFVNGPYLWIKNNEQQIKASLGDYISYNEETIKFEVNKK